MAGTADMEATMDGMGRWWWIRAVATLVALAALALALEAGRRWA